MQSVDEKGFLTSHLQPGTSMSSLVNCDSNMSTDNYPIGHLSSPSLDEDIRLCFTKIRGLLEQLQTKIIERSDEIKTNDARNELLAKLDIYQDASLGLSVSQAKEQHDEVRFARHRNSIRSKGNGDKNTARTTATIEENMVQEKSVVKDEQVGNETESNQEALSVENTEKYTRVVNCNQTHEDNRSVDNIVVALDPKNYMPDSDDENDPIKSTGNQSTHSARKISRAKNRENKCNICEQTFTQRGSLIRHIRGHSGLRPFPCTLCGKRFADKERLKVHNRTHTGEKPFACDVCDQRFSQKSTVTRHMSVHRRPRSFTCIICEKNFSSTNGLRVHQQTQHFPTRAAELKTNSRQVPMISMSAQ